MHAAGMIIREEGILGLWAGAAPTVMRNGTNQVNAAAAVPPLLARSTPTHSWCIVQQRLKVTSSLQDISAVCLIVRVLWLLSGDA